MNQYFSRLAQRSAVTPQTSTARPGGTYSAAEPGWSEQSVEIAAPSNATASGKNDDTEYGKEVLTTATSKQDHVMETSPPSNAVFASIDPSQKNQAHRNALTPSISQAGSETQSVTSSFHEHDQVIEQTAEKVSAPTVSAPTTSPVSTTIKSVSIFSGQASSQQGAEEPEANQQVFRASAFDAAVTGALSRSPTNRNEKSAMATSGFENAGINESNSAQVIRNSPVPPVQAVKSERVMSGPVQAAALPVQASRPASRSSIEVNIGKIELEVYAPATKASAPATPAPTSAPRSKPAAVFNPHRHYLRGR